MHRLSQGGEKWIDIEIPIHKHGYITLIDYMGNDDRIVEAARQSTTGDTKTPEKDRVLIRYMMEHGHSSPFEQVETVWKVKLPIFVARQWIRHRTACLAGDTILSFDLPGGKTGSGNPRHYPLTVHEVYKRWQPTENRSRPDKQKNPLFKRERVQGMLLRSYNEKDGSIYHTNITDIWESGVKAIIDVEFEDGSTLRASKDHMCLTEYGWMKLEDALENLVRFVGSGKKKAPVPFLRQANYDFENWREIPGWENKYEVSDHGRVRSYIRSGRTNNRITEIPTIKKLTNSAGYNVVSLSFNGISRAFHVHRLVAEAYLGPCPNGMEVRHLNGNTLDNRVENLTYGTPQENTNDRMQQNGDQGLVPKYVRVADWKECSPEMTYDIEVSGPFHNFFGGGVVVHNSINEYSGRYSILPDEAYIPSRERLARSGQDTVNNQGSKQYDALTESNITCIRMGMAEDQVSAFEGYHHWLDYYGLSKEISRINLPLSSYTTWMWKIDLHNLFHFLKLRTDSHAQEEIRVYAEAMEKVIADLVPVAYEAWVDYKKNAIPVSRMDSELLLELANQHGDDLHIAIKRILSKR